jgi:hypothetical protein
MPRRAALPGPGPARGVLRHVRPRLHCPQGLDTGLRVIRLVPAHRAAVVAGQLGPPLHRGFPFGRAGGLGQAGIDAQAVTVLPPYLPQRAQLGFRPLGLLVQPGVGIGGRGLRGRAPRLPPTLDARVTRVVGGRGRGGGLGLKALEAGPGRAQGPIDRQGLARQQLLAAGAGQNLCEEGVGYRAGAQARAVLGEDRGVPDGLVVRPTNQRNRRL